MVVLLLVFQGLRGWFHRIVRIVAHLMNQGCSLKAEASQYFAPTRFHAVPAPCPRRAR